MGHEQEGVLEPALQAQQLDLHLLAELEIERRERLVEQQDLGAVDQRARERDALLLAARERVDPARAEALHLDERQGLVHAGLELGSGTFFMRRPKAMFSHTLRCGKSA